MLTYTVDQLSFLLLLE